MTPNQLKFFKIIKDKKYFQQHQKILVAVSGGQDSMTLFNWLYNLRLELKIDLGIAHINHGIREESTYEEQALRKKAKELSIPIYIGKFTGKFTEEKGREFRYHFFEKIMQSHGYTAIVTAHHKEDVVETVLMREITGRPLRSLQGIAERQNFSTGELIRPLLQFTKAELDASEFFEDWTNQGTDYLRNRIRNQIIPILSKENPQFSEAMISLTSEITMAMSIIEEKILNSGIISEKVKVAEFCLQSKAMQHFILQKYFTQYPDLIINKAKFEELLHIINRPQQYRGDLNKSVLFVKTKEEFYIEKYKNELTDDKNELLVLKENPFDETYMRIDLPEKGMVEIRKRQGGDKILINGHHKKLRKYFIEHKIPLEKRNNFVILVDKKLYAVVDVVCSDLSKTAKNNKMRRTLWVKSSVREEEKHV